MRLAYLTFFTRLLFIRSYYNDSCIDLYFTINLFSSYFVRKGIITTDLVNAINNHRGTGRSRPFQAYLDFIPKFLIHSHIGLGVYRLYVTGA